MKSFYQNVEPYLPLIFECSPDQFRFHFAAYYQEIQEENLNVHCFIQFKQEDVGFFIFKQKKCDFPSLTAFTCIRSQVKEKWNILVLQDRCHRFLPTCFRILHGILNWKKVRESFVPTRMDGLEVDYFDPIDVVPCESPQFCFPDPQLLPVPQHKWDLAEIHLSPWCEENALFCTKYGGIPTPLFEAMKKQMLREKKAHLEEESPEPIHLWTKISVLSQLGITFSETKQKQYEHKSGPILCRYHALESAYFSRQPHVLNAMLHFLTQKSQQVENPHTQAETERRLARLVDYAAEENKPKLLDEFLKSPLVERKKKDSFGKQLCCTTKALYWQTSHGNLEEVALLFKKKAPLSPETMYTACRNGRTQLVLFLLNRGIHCDLLEAVDCAFMNGHYDTKKAIEVWCKKQLDFKVWPTFYSENSSTGSALAWIQQMQFVILLATK